MGVAGRRAGGFGAGRCWLAAWPGCQGGRGTGSRWETQEGGFGDPTPGPPDSPSPQEKCVNCSRRFRCTQGFQLEVRTGAQPGSLLCRCPTPGGPAGWQPCGDGTARAAPSLLEAGGPRAQDGLSPSLPDLPSSSSTDPCLPVCPFTALPLPKPQAEPSCLSSFPEHPQEELCLPIGLLLLPGLFLHMCQEDPGLPRSTPTPKSGQKGGGGGAGPGEEAGLDFNGRSRAGTRVRPVEQGPRARGLRSVGPVSVLWPYPREWGWGEGKGLSLDTIKQAPGAAVGPAQVPYRGIRHSCPWPEALFPHPCHPRVEEGGLHFPGSCLLHCLALQPAPTAPTTSRHFPSPYIWPVPASPRPLPTGA